MSVKTSTFGGAVLSGEDWAKLTEQLESKKPNQAATESAKRGKKLLDELEEKGFIAVKT